MFIPLACLGYKQILSCGRFCLTSNVGPSTQRNGIGICSARQHLRSLCQCRMITEPGGLSVISFYCQIGHKMALSLARGLCLHLHRHQIRCFYRHAQHGNGVETVASWVRCTNDSCITGASHLDTERLPEVSLLCWSSCLFLHRAKKTGLT